LAIFFAALALSSGSPVPQRGSRPQPGRRPGPGRPNNTGTGTVAAAGTAGFAGGHQAQPVANAVGGLFGK